MDGGTPQWYDVKYAYSGLHSIINPPPANVHMFQQKPEKIDIKVLVARKVQEHQRIGIEPATGPPECDFCFANYQKYRCQFYRPQTAEFQVTVYRNGNMIVCECCDFSDDENDCGASNSSEDLPLKSLIENSNSNTETGQDTSGAATPNVAASEEVAPAEEQPVAPKIQPGWYGKGWRRLQRKRKRASAGS